MSASVTVVVLSYNRPRLLAQSLAALAAQTYPADRLEILVVDNRSPASAEIARIVAAHPRMRLVAPPENLGFTGGMNLGLREASGDLVYLTEDDILLEPDNVAELVRYIEGDPRAGIVAGIMLDEPTGRIWFAGGDVTLGPSLRIDLPGRDEADLGRFVEPFRVSYICGATMLARREVWAELGGFREEFFMYQEDVELGLRVLQSGRALVIVPSARCRHFRPQEGAFAPAIAYHKWKNIFALYALHAPARVLPEFFLRCGLWSLRSTPEEGGPPLRAWAYFAQRLPALLRERTRASHAG
jgi:GT2 family glycosyltransferase